MRFLSAAVLAAAAAAPVVMFPTAGSAQVKDEPYIVEYYYKAKWGYAEEFLTLFKKNHLPLLLAEIERGSILSVSAMVPAYHATEEGRWDYRMTITFKNAAVAAAGSPLTAEDRRKLFPDEATFTREEQRRFETLLAHWDVPVRPLALKP